MSFLPISESCGRIEMVTGPMGAEKTSYLISVIRQYARAEKRIAVFKHCMDDRGQGEDFISTHNEDTYKAFSCSTIEQIVNKIKYLEKKKDGALECIFIDEGQFFKDIHLLVEELANSGKFVMVSGLMTTHTREPFGDFPKIAAMAENIWCKQGICRYCKHQASFTSKLEGDMSISTEVGGLEDYAPVCRGCHKEKYPDLHHK